MAAHLSTADCYERLDDTRCMIVTPNARGDEGAIIAVRVACEFLKSLNGSCDLSNVRIELAESLTGEGIQTVPLRLDRVASLVERAQVTDVILPPHLRRGAPPPAEETVRAAHKEMKINHQFEPVWDARHEAITTYICRPHQVMCDAASPVALQLDELNARERINLEISGLLAGAHELSLKVETGDRFLLCMPLSFDTMCSPYGRSEIVRTCQGLPVLYRQYISFLITGVPPGVSCSRLTDLAMALRPFGRVTATVAAGCRTFNAYEGHGLSALALDLANAGSDTESTRADIVHIAAAARTLKCTTMVLNVDNHEMFNVVHAADCQLIHGLVISPPRAEPRRMSRLACASLQQPAAQSDSETWF
ncbi:MAG: hypothetical protein ACXWLT_01145 [Rhizomicrobium sp.]